MKDELTPDLPEGPESLKPKRPTRDYSDLPQRPIKLKSDIGGLVIPRPKVSDDASAKIKPQTKSVPKSRRRRPVAAAPKWDLQGISEVVLEAAANAAREDGMSMDRWVEQAILHALVESETPEPVEPEPPEPIVIESPDMKALNQRLEEISQHLQRIEKQRGFWMQLWDRLISEGRS